MIEYFYNLSALTGVFLLIAVMQMTERDRVNRVDPLTVQWGRRAGFVFGALAFCYSILCTDWQPSGPVLALAAAADVILAVNVLALYYRAPPAPLRQQRRFHRNTVPWR